MHDTLVRSWASGSIVHRCAWKHCLITSFKHFIYSGSVIFITPEAFFLIHIHSLKQSREEHKETNSKQVHQPLTFSRLKSIRHDLKTRSLMHKTLRRIHPKHSPENAPNSLQRERLHHHVSSLKYPYMELTTLVLLCITSSAYHLHMHIPTCVIWIYIWPCFWVQEYKKWLTAYCFLHIKDCKSLSINHTANIDSK